jgi:hypothetical protein
MRGRVAIIDAVALLLLGLGAAGCSAEAAGTGGEAGSWVVAATETARSCSAFAGIRPFPSGELHIDDHGGFRWQPAVGVDVAYRAVAQGVYRRLVTTSQSGCQIRADAYFKLGEVTPDRLRGTYQVTYTRKTDTDRCQVVPDTCELRFDIVARKRLRPKLARN